MQSSKLSKPNSKEIHKSKKITAVTVALGLILGFLTGTQFLIQGVENSLVSEDNKLFPNTTYLVASGCQNSGDTQSNTDCTTDTGTIDNKIASKIKPYGGTIAGNFTIIKKQNIYFYTASPEPFRHILEANSISQPNDKLSAVIGFGMATELVKNQLVTKSYDDNKIAFVNEVRQKTIGKTFKINGLDVFIAGIIPYGSDNFRITKQGDNLQPLNQILQLTDGNSTSTNMVILFANNSTAFQQLLTQSTISQKLAIIGFNNRNQAYNFYYQEKLRHNPDNLSRSSKADGQELEIGEFITSTLSSIYWFKKAKMIIAIISSILIFITIIIFALIIKRVTTDSPTRFRSMLNLSLRFLVTSIAVAIIIVIIASYHNKELYNSALSLLFGHETSGFKLLFGLNPELLVTALAIPMVAFLVTFMIYRKQSHF